MNYSHDTSGCGGRCILELIRARAYQHYQARRGESHNELDDWLRAELEVKHHLGFETIREPENTETY